MLPALAWLASMTVLAQPAPVDPNRWNLAEIYADVGAWDADAKRLDDALPALTACRGHLGDDAATLRRCLDLQAAINQRLYRLYSYASLRLDEDTGVAASLERADRVRLQLARVTEAGAFVTPELLAIGRARIDAFAAAEPGLRPYRHALDDALRHAEHTLDAQGEAMLAAWGATTDTPRTTYSIFTQSELPWPKIRLSDGTEATLDEPGYELHRAAANRADRKAAMDAFFGALKGFERTLGVTYYGQLKQDAVTARLRRYPDSITRALDNDRLPRAVYDQLIAQTNASLPTLHRYFRLRARMLGITDMGYHDIYVPLVQGGPGFPIATARATMLAAVKPLGDDYGAAMKRGLAGRWMDVYPRARKQSGAYQNGFVYELHPYLLLNYHDTYDSLDALTHEWGHAMHTVLANASQPFPTADYAIFVAEIASTLNEHLLMEHMLAQARSDDERLLYLGQALEMMRATYFRQAMFAEFEYEAHARADRGEALSGEAFTRIYGELLRRYHGDAVKIDDRYAIEWAYISHFYHGYYVFQYATSIAASALFAQRILSDEPGARERYLEMLRAGGSDYPYDLVRRAGVDLAQPEPYQALVARMNAVMDKIESILARRG
jgi:oligoendopeptidase F